MHQRRERGSAPQTRLRRKLWGQVLSSPLGVWHPTYSDVSDSRCKLGKKQEKRGFPGLLHVSSGKSSVNGQAGSCLHWVMLSGPHELPGCHWVWKEIGFVCWRWVAQRFSQRFVLQRVPKRLLSFCAQMICNVKKLLLCIAHDGRKGHNNIMWILNYLVKYQSSCLWQRTVLE